MDLSKITKAFQNVVQKAIQFSPEDGTVSLSFFNFNRSYNIVIKDNGKGFSEEALNRATEKFYITSLDRGDKHYGLGLSIVESIVREHKGIIEIKNIKREDKIIGASVTLAIPVV
ncbi:sensor histidine kinase [Cerasibacillus sp. JNUCC 74]